MKQENMKSIPDSGGNKWGRQLKKKEKHKNIIHQPQFPT
jgi:hypothetical protein